MKKLDTPITWKALIIFSAICTVIGLLAAAGYTVYLWWDNIKVWVDQKVERIRAKFKK